MAIHLALVLMLSTQAAAPSRGEVGKMGVLIGTIETKGPADAEYRPLVQGASVEEGAWIRSAEKSKGILDLADGSEIRINEKTEFIVRKFRDIDLKVGQIYLRATQGPIFMIQTPFAPVTIPVGTIDISFNPNDPKFVVAPNRAITMIHSFEGMPTIKSKKYTEHCPVGNYLFMVDATCNTPERAKDRVLAATWVHEVILARNPRPAEVRHRIDRLVGMLMDAGNTVPAETALKEFGEAAVSSVSEVLKISPKDSLNVPPRRKAARIISEVAGLAATKELRAMIDDTDAEIRVLGAKGLARLAGQDLGYRDDYWKGSQTKAGLDAWDRWLKDKASSAQAPK